MSGERMRAERSLIARRRRALGYTRAAFAHAMGVEAAVVEQWENGHAAPPQADMGVLARLLHLAPDELTLPEPAPPHPRAPAQEPDERTRAELDEDIIMWELGERRAVVPDLFWEAPAVRDAVERLDVGAVVRALYARTQLSQTHIARMSGLAQSTVSALIARRQQVTTLAKVYTALNGLGAPLPPATATGPAHHDERPAPAHRAHPATPEQSARGGRER